MSSNIFRSLFSTLLSFAFRKVAFTKIPVFGILFLTSHLLVTEKFLFLTFRWWEIQSFLRQKLNGKMIFTDCWKVLVLGYGKFIVLNFLVMVNKVFFSQKVDVKIIYTWFFWAFNDISGPGKDSFLCSANYRPKALYSPKN